MNDKTFNMEVSEFLKTAEATSKREIGRIQGPASISIPSQGGAFSIPGRASLVAEPSPELARAFIF